MYICMARWLAGATPTSSFVMFMYPSSTVNNYLDKCVPHVSEIFAAYIKLCMGVCVCVRESPSIRFTTNKIEAYPSKLIAYPALFIICRSMACTFARVPCKYVTVTPSPRGTQTRSFLSYIEYGCIHDRSRFWLRTTTMMMTLTTTTHSRVLSKCVAI